MATIRPVARRPTLRRLSPRHFAPAGLLWLALLAVTWVLGLVVGAGSSALGSEFRNPDGIAVIVGNLEYAHTFDVPYAHRDADAFERYVVDVLGFDPRNLVVSKNATLVEFDSVFGPGGDLESLVETRRIVNDGATVSDVVVFYSGHGMPSLDRDKPDTFMLPIDARPQDPARYGYSISELYRILGELPVKSVSVFVDACFSGASGAGPLVRASPMMVTRLPKEVSENTVVFTAAKADQVAFWDDDAGHGLFTHHLLDALYGGGDKDGDGTVTAEEVNRYLREHLFYASRDKFGGRQIADVIDGTGTGARVLAAASADGSFPTRPDLDSPDPVPVVEGPGVDDSTDSDDPSPPALDLAAVTGGDAFLVVETAPPGATVLVGGARVGETPLERYDLRAGTYTVTLDHPTHETVVLKNQSLESHLVLRIEQALKPATGKVTVITRPSGGWVEHDGARLADSTPVTLDGRPSGPQVLTLGAADHHTVRVEVDVPKGDVALVERTLEKIRYGTLTLDLEPADARVALPDGATPYRAGMRLREGEHRIRVTREGYREVSRVVAVSGNTRERITLKRAPQPFTVVTTPADAAVRFVDGTGSYRPGMKLLPGTYRVWVSAEGWKTREVTVNHGTSPTRHAVKLKRNPQPFTVVTTPADAEVRFLDGTGSYRPGMNLLPGTYRVRVSATGWKTQEATVNHGTNPTRHAVRLARLPPGGRPPGGRFKDCNECPWMVAVPAGSFTMGSPSSEERRYDDEDPQRGVTIVPFAVGKYEVTFAEWDVCVATGGCNGYVPDDMGWGRGLRPVINVSWEDAKAYVAWLSDKTDNRYRLLSEAEWEYAARARTTGPFHLGPTISTDQANYDGNFTYGSGRMGVYRGKTVPVGSFPPNGFALHDVHGNVWEWVEDCWHDGYAGAPEDGRAWVSGGDCGVRVLRGGSWYNEPWFLRSGVRLPYSREHRGDRYGFRVARSLTP